ncbi:NADPH-dependent 1-acyl dihydroxyacetone phosphate reductase [Exserohilum turcicum]
MSTRQRTVLVTGCTPGGIGHELALEFLRQGFQVFGTVRSDEAKKTLLSEGVIAIEHEVTSAESIQALHDVLCKRIVDGMLDILINNAGISFTVPVLDLTIENMRKVFEINVFGGVLLTQKLAPMLIAAKGKVANIGSVAGVIPYVFGGCYNASKAALHALTDALRIEMEPFGVQVVLVATAGVKSKTSDVKKRLPPNSLYMPIEEDYLFRQGNSQRTAMPTEVYAKKVVADLLKPKTSAWLWHGHQASVVRWLSWLMPRTFWDNYFAKKFGLRKFKA